MCSTKNKNNKPTSPPAEYIKQQINHRRHFHLKVTANACLSTYVLYLKITNTGKGAVQHHHAVYPFPSFSLDASGVFVGKVGSLHWNGLADVVVLLIHNLSAKDFGVWLVEG